MALKHVNVRGAVLESLRVTPRILEVLSHFVNRDEILKRITREFRRKDDQVPIKTEDIKQQARKIAVEVGLGILPSACVAILIHIIRVATYVGMVLVIISGLKMRIIYTNF